MTQWLRPIILTCHSTLTLSAPVNLSVKICMRLEPATDGLQALATEPLALRMRFWEYKDRNMHRGIVDFEPSVEQSREQIEVAVRKQVLETYSPTWARGFAFGLILQFEQTPTFGLQEFAGCIDGYNKSKGVWQWVIAVDHEKRVAFAAHMWMQGWLHPMFDKTVNDITALGYQVSREYMSKPGLFKGIDRYANFAPKAIRAVKKFQFAVFVMFVVYLIYEYFN